MEIDDFLFEVGEQPEWVGERKLTDHEKDSPKQEVTNEELTTSMEASNFGSSSRWDEISFKVLRKYCMNTGAVMSKMANKTFQSRN
jgi:hypothetical protein